MTGRLFDLGAKPLSTSNTGVVGSVRVFLVRENLREQANAQRAKLLAHSESEPSPASDRLATLSSPEEAVCGVSRTCVRMG